MHWGVYQRKKKKSEEEVTGGQLPARDRHANRERGGGRGGEEDQNRTGPVKQERNEEKRMRGGVSGGITRRWGRLDEQRRGAVRAPRSTHALAQTHTNTTNVEQMGVHVQGGGEGGEERKELG